MREREGEKVKLKEGKRKQSDSEQSLKPPPHQAFCLPVVPLSLILALPLPGTHKTNKSMPWRMHARMQASRQLGSSRSHADRQTGRHLERSRHVDGGEYEPGAVAQLERVNRGGGRRSRRRRRRC